MGGPGALQGAPVGLGPWGGRPGRAPQPPAIGPPGAPPALPGVALTLHEPCSAPGSRVGSVRQNAGLGGRLPGGYLQQAEDPGADDRAGNAEGHHRDHLAACHEPVPLHVAPPCLIIVPQRVAVTRGYGFFGSQRLCSGIDSVYSRTARATSVCPADSASRAMSLPSLSMMSFIICDIWLMSSGIVL